MNETLRPKPATPNWFSRNWKWLVPTAAAIIIASIVAFVAAIMMLVFGMIKSSEPYTQAFDHAISEPAIQEILGEPIEDGLFITGNINISGSSGHADLAIPLKGPRGKATLFVVAEKSAGLWHFQTLIFQDKATNQRINLLTEE